MRRAILMHLLACTLASGCASSSVTTQTVTVVHTITAARPTPSRRTTSTTHTLRPPTTPGGPTVPPSNVATSAPGPPAPQVLTVDPLTADCPTILDATDVHKTLGMTIPDGYQWKKDVPNPARGVIGKIRCYYPKEDTQGHGPVVIALTKYNTAAAAATQTTATVDSEINAGAAASTPLVNGYPAHLLLRSGGLIVVQYSTWTLAIATLGTLAGNAALTSGLPALAARVLTRIIKNN